MRILRKILITILILIALSAIVYFLGPVYPYDPFDANPIVTDTPIEQVEDIINANESQYTIKPDNESRVIWYDGMKKTEYGILYLHGWFASQGEGAPVHTNLAQQYGTNLILARQPGHGLITEEPLLDVTAKDEMDYAKTMIDLASKTCEKLIVISQSTGCTYSSYLSSTDDRIYAQIMISPNFGVADPSFDLLDGPWGLQIVRKVLGSKYREWKGPPGTEKFWFTKIRAEGLIVLDQIVSNTMNPEVFKKIQSPVYIAYYYENHEKQDVVINASLIEPFVKAISTDSNMVRTHAFTGDLRHVLISEIMNKDYLFVQKSISEYLEQVLGLSVVGTNGTDN